MTFLPAANGSPGPRPAAPPSGLRVTGVETVALRDPAAGAAATLVKVHTDAGLTGLGQAEAPSLVVDALVRCDGGLADLVRGEDPLQPGRLWDKMYAGTAVFGRRGVTIAAVGAVETALWDIAGKAAGKPVCELIWRSCGAAGARAEVRRHVLPYATVYPPGSTPDEVRARFTAAVGRGFRAAKLEPWAGGFGRVDPATDGALASLVRGVLGPDRALMVDVCEHWADVGRAVAGVRAVEGCDVYFVEAPLPADGLDAYARLAAAVPGVRIAAGDSGFTTRWEFDDLLDRARVGVAQPATGGGGGGGELLPAAAAPPRRGALCVPHSWCHMVGVAASVHLAAVLPNMPYVEYPVAFPDSPVISGLLDPPLAPDADGRLAVPDRPGLGFDLNPGVVAKYRVAPY